ncbi:MAG: hypothetical protein HC896_15505 [Bacteroidales bacterium]|nr:hypothetical protein [Bacteroidales bacterium]
MDIVQKDVELAYLTQNQIKDLVASLGNERFVASVEKTLARNTKKTSQ